MNKPVPDKSELFRINDQSFKLIYNKHWEKLYTVCYSKINDSEVAKELVQEIFFSLWQRKDTLTIEGPVEHYLLRAAKLKTLEYYRLLTIRTRHLENVRDQQKTEENTTLDHVELNELNAQLQHFVHAMPGQCRKVFELSRSQGLNTREIATEMVLSEKTVKNHLTRALHFLKEKLDKGTGYSAV
ncbi:RNA polymerase sigma-70 factor [Dyadobacter diqingensis]|uniref:RNA polymerase sigma-70 factor n=1 Tax=Dyadobacter diqingensis TaxID=2938121 RepID=UPI0020C27781|nr:RNA polymerase sigma-70 factor [Dyadobacter diqingensis]